MALSPEYRKKLRERLMGKGFSPKKNLEKPLSSIEESSSPFNYWKNSKNPTMIKKTDPGQYSWNSKAGYGENIKLYENHPSKKELKPLTERKKKEKIDTFSEKKYKII